MIHNPSCEYPPNGRENLCMGYEDYGFCFQALKYEIQYNFIRLKSTIINSFYLENVDKSAQKSTKKKKKVNNRNRFKPNKEILRDRSGAVGNFLYILILCLEQFFYLVLIPLQYQLFYFFVPSFLFLFFPLIFSTQEVTRN